MSKYVSALTIGLGPLRTDTISEKTAEAGVAIDGVLVKDGAVATTMVSTDNISEKTLEAGVTIDGVLIKDGSVSTDTISEKTPESGVTIDGVLVKDNTIAANTIKLSTGAVTGHYLRSDATGLGSWGPFMPPDPATGTLYVAKNGNDTTGNGSVNAPFLTISKALSVVTGGALSTTVIKVASGDYPEYFTIDAQDRQLILEADGRVTGVTVVTIESSNYVDTQPTVSFTCSRNLTPIADNSRPGVYWDWDLGSIAITTLANLALSGVDASSITQTGTLGTNCWIYLTNCRFLGNITTENASLVHAIDCAIHGTITTQYIGAFQGCLLGSLSLHWGARTTGTEIEGLYNCRFKNNAVLTNTNIGWVPFDMDGDTYNSFKTSGCSVVGTYLFRIRDLPKDVVRDTIVVTSNNYVIDPTTYDTVYNASPTANWTLHLPLLSSTHNPWYGRQLQFRNTSATYTLTIQAAGNDRIWDTTTTSVVMPGNSNLTLTGGDSTNLRWF